MKIALCSEGDSLDSKVDSRFGRCAYFILVETNTGEVEVVANQSVAAGHGAGIGSVQFLVSRGVEAVCTAKVGPNAFQAFASAGIKVYFTEPATVRQALEDFKAGKLKQITSPNV